MPGDTGLGDQEGRAHLLFQFAAELVPRDLVERLDGVRDQGAVDQDLDLAHGGPDLVDHAEHGGPVAYVGRYGHRPAAGGPDRRDHAVGLVAAAAVVDDDPHAP